MSWRPKEYKNPYNPRNSVLEKTAYDNFEAGADAMWEGLFKMAKDSPTKTFIIYSRMVDIYSEGTRCP